MRFMALLAAIAVVSQCGAHADETTAQERTRSEAVLKMTPNGDQFWESLGDGAIRHKRSGLVCAANAEPSMILVQLSDLDPADPGKNVGCSYRAADQAKRTDLFATQAPPGGTTESEFKALREVLLARNKDAAPLTPVNVLLVPGARGEAFTMTGDDGKTVFQFLYVIAVKDWIVWCRVRLPGTTFDQKNAEVLNLFGQANFTIGAGGVMRTAKGIPEPRAN